MAARDVGLSECGLPKTPSRSSVVVLPDLRLGVQPAAGVVEIDLVLRVEPGVLARAQVVDGVPVRVRVRLRPAAAGDGPDGLGGGR